MKKNITIFLSALLVCGSLAFAADGSNAEDPSNTNPQGAGVGVTGSNTVKDVCDCNLSSAQILPKDEHCQLLPEGCSGASSTGSTGSTSQGTK